MELLIAEGLILLHYYLLFLGTQERVCFDDLLFNAPIQKGFEVAK